MKFPLIIAPLAHTIHSYALRSLNPSQSYHSRHKFALFFSQTNVPNQVNIEDCVDKTFEASWNECKAKVPDLTCIFTSYLEYHSDIEITRSEPVDVIPSVENGDNYDVKITCSNADKKPTRPILAHRSMLSASSPVFKQYLSTATETNGVYDLHIPDIDKEVLKEIVHFIYNFKFSKGLNTILTEDLGKKYLYIALKYKITDLICLFDEVLSTQVNMDNMCALRQLAFLFDLKDLMEACRHEISDYPEMAKQHLEAYALRGLTGGWEEKVNEGKEEDKGGDEDEE